MGIDMDGPANDKGLYAIAPIRRHMSIRNKDMVQWNADGRVGATRVGFMSQVSPDGRYVVSTFAGPALDVPRNVLRHQFQGLPLLAGLLSNPRHPGVVQPRHGHSASLCPAPTIPILCRRTAFGAPTASTIVFARAEARNPRADGQKPALYANDPNETQIQYDLYRVPFNNGKGGTPEPIAGASQNGMSNNFPKVSPDGNGSSSSNAITAS